MFLLEKDILQADVLPRNPPSGLGCFQRDTISDHHHRFDIRFSMLAWVGWLSPTASGSQLYKTQPLLKAQEFNPVLPGKLV